MTALHLALPESLTRFAEERALARKSSISDYFAALLRRDQAVFAKEKLEELLVEGLQSGEPMSVTDEYWNEKRQKLSASESRKIQK
ncbi:MAG: type II toxin-antitoxin system ParD family antitoxin [Planctomycetes bacterium]|nr:type II toxin-antitoxin system ParD family antitoxin [Planctomycetota bacterium]